MHKNYVISTPPTAEALRDDCEAALAGPSSSGSSRGLCCYEPEETRSQSPSNGAEEEPAGGNDIGFRLQSAPAGGRTDARCSSSKDCPVAAQTAHANVIDNFRCSAIRNEEIEAKRCMSPHSRVPYLQRLKGPHQSSAVCGPRHFHTDAEQSPPARAGSIATEVTATRNSDLTLIVTASMLGELQRDEQSRASDSNSSKICHAAKELTKQATRAQTLSQMGCHLQASICHLACLEPRKS
jgi:hypothetical protein